MTSFYMFRLWFKTFFGPEHFEEHADLHDHGAAVHAYSGSHAVMVADPEETHAHGVHESPWIMLVPLVILAILSFIGGWVGVPAAMGGHDEIGHFLDPVFASGAAAEAANVASHGLELGLAAHLRPRRRDRLLHRLHLLLQEARHRRQLSPARSPLSTASSKTSSTSTRSTALSSSLRC